MLLIFRYILALLGLISLLLGGSILLDLFKIRDFAGNYNSYIVGINVLLGVVYLILAFFYNYVKNHIGIILVLAAIVLIISYIGLRIFDGIEETYNTRIFNILYFRIYFTLLLSAFAYALRDNYTKTTTNRE